MSLEVVKYHNDLNKIKLPNFTELEQNLLFAILSQIKEQTHIYLNDSEILALLNLNYRLDKHDAVYMLKSLKDKFFKADFTIISKEKINIKGVEKEVMCDRTVNLFKEFAIYYDKESWEPLPEPFVTRFYGIELVINEKFAYLVRELTKEFTRFELAEFVNLSGKYTKTLYRLLKQYRTMGKMRMQWDEFVRIMDIPQSYQMCDIEKQILKPALKELTKERNLFDQKRTPFKNLAYEKIKEKGTRGRGGKVIGIEFSFKPETLKNTELTDERKFDLGKLISSKWYHRALGVFEITSGDTSDKSNLIINYSLENGDCGSFKFKNFNELQLKFAEFEPYA